MMLKFSLTLLIGLTCCLIVDGFHTDTCPHEKLATQSKRFIKCIHKSLVESTEHLLTDYRNQIDANNYVYNATKGCQIFMGSLIELKECRTTYLGQCFDNYPTMLENKIFDSLTHICETNFDSDKLEDWGEELEHKLENTTISEVQTFLADFDKEDVLKSDHNCSEEEWEHSFKDDLDSKQCEVTRQEFSVAFESPLIELVIPIHMSLCTAMANVLGSCVKENSCVNKQEVELIHQLLWMAYQIPMDMFIKVRDAFGSLQDLDEEIDKTTLQFGLTVIPPHGKGSDSDNYQNKIVNHLMESVIDDYETHACRALVSHALHELDPTSPKPPSTQKSVHSSNVALWLCSITLVIVLIGIIYLVATKTEVGRRMTGRLTNKKYGNMYASTSTIGTFETPPRTNGIFR